MNRINIVLDQNRSSMTVLNDNLFVSHQSRPPPIKKFTYEMSSNVSKDTIINFLHRQSYYYVKTLKAAPLTQVDNRLE